MAENRQTITIQQALDLAVQHHTEGRLSDAETICQQILQTDPDQPVALHLLGVIAHQSGENDLAVERITRVLAIKPDYAQAHNTLGNTLREFGKPEEAVASYHKALSINPEYAEAYNNFGTALQDLGKPEEAIVSYHRALAIKPDFAGAHSNLGNALHELGRQEEAVASHRRAISLDPQNDYLWANFAISLKAASFTSVDDNIYQDLLHLLDMPTVSPSYIIRPVINALRHHSYISALLDVTNCKQRDSKISYHDVAEQLSRIPLLLQILLLSPINDLEIEQMLTVMRHAMLEETTEKKTKGKLFPFSVALAVHCFVNEYIFEETEEEREAVENLAAQTATLLDKEEDVPPCFIVTLAAYRPLFRFPWSQRLSKQKSQNNIKRVIEQQIIEPMKEQALCKEIPCMTDTQNAISQSVRELYEENPWPLWIKIGLRNKSRSIGAILKGPPLSFDLGDHVSPEKPQILIAGCGTGMHALLAASTYSNAHVLAVDLSLNSLAYAKRKTQELGFSNIEYAQGDILEFGKIEQRFDLIECVGVLHHFDDPLTGWKILTDLLHPGGLMRIALYSEIARKGVTQGRSLITEKGYSTSLEDIRKCRQDIILMARHGDTLMGKICGALDFFSMSGCRDLLFHVQEHQFTLLQIEAALMSLKLKFLGFEISDQTVVRKFPESHPHNDLSTSLAQWHKFELANPDTFSNMYSFWCQKL